MVNCREIFNKEILEYMGKTSKKYKDLMVLDKVICRKIRNFKNKWFKGQRKVENKKLKNKKTMKFKRVMVIMKDQMKRM